MAGSGLASMAGDDSSPGEMAEAAGLTSKEAAAETEVRQTSSADVPCLVHCASCWAHAVSSLLASVSRQLHGVCCQLHAAVNETLPARKSASGPIVARYFYLSITLLSDISRRDKSAMFVSSPTKPCLKPCC